MDCQSFCCNIINISFPSCQLFTSQTAPGSRTRSQLQFRFESRFNSELSEATTKRKKYVHFSPPTNKYDRQKWPFNEIRF